MFRSYVKALLCFFVLCLACTASSEASKLRIFLRIDAENSRMPEGQGVVSLSFSSKSGEIIFRADATAPGVAEFELAPNKELMVTVHSKQWWAPQTAISPVPEGAKAEASITLEPATELRFRVGQVSGELLPESLMVAFFLDDPEKVENPQLTRQTCLPGLKNGAFHCVIPSRIRDFRLNASGFVSSFLWDRKLPPGGEMDLGELRLKRGGSLVGRVITWDGHPLPRDITISVFPEGLAMKRGPKGRFAMIDRARLMPHNFFQFSALDPGAYTLRAVGGNYAPVELHNIEILPGRESNLMEGLSLKPPVIVDVIIDPPTDSDGKPWSVSFGSSSDPREIPVVEADAGGLASATDLHYGKYLVMVQGQDGHRVWANVISFDMPKIFLPIDLDLIAVEGVLQIGDDPLAAHLLFGGRFGAVSVEMESDKKGDFFGNLPRVGKWNVDVHAIEDSFAMTVMVDVPQPKSGKSKLEITLPDTTLEGTVVTEQGIPPTDETKVSIRPIEPEGTWTDVDVDPEGKFLFRGLPEGPVRIMADSAWAEEGCSEVQQLMLKAGNPVRKRLVLHPKRLVEGILNAGGRPLPGARVVLDPLGPLDRSCQTLSDARGHWKCRVPRNESRFTVNIFPPGWGAVTFLHQLGSEASETEFIKIDVGRTTGSLAISYPPDSDIDVPQHMIFLRHRFGTLSNYQLGRWARANDSSIPFPAEAGLLRTGPLEVGLYDVCRFELGSPDWLHFLMDPYWRPRTCKSIEVSPGSDTEMSLDSDGGD